jgi:hypothetical protein
LRLAVELEAAVHARDHKIEPGHNLIGIIQRAVGEDVGFDALEDTEALSKTLIETINLNMLLFDLVDRQAARVMCGFRGGLPA